MGPPTWQRMLRKVKYEEQYLHFRLERRSGLEQSSDVFMYYLSMTTTSVFCQTEHRQPDNYDFTTSYPNTGTGKRRKACHTIMESGRRTRMSGFARTLTSRSILSLILTPNPHEMRCKLALPSGARIGHSMCGYYTQSS